MDTPKIFQTERMTVPEEYIFDDMDGEEADENYVDQDDELIEDEP